MNAEQASPRPEKVTTVIRPEPIIKADTMAYVRFSRRDPGEMERFLLDFGLIATEARDGVRHYRGCGASPFLVQIEPAADDAFLGFGVAVREQNDLERIATATGVPIEESAAPGGGRRARLIDPDGLAVDVVCGQQPVAELAAPTVLGPINTPSVKARINQTVRPPLAPSPIFRLGHLVIQRPDFDRAAQWYMRHIGLLASDVQALPDGSPGMIFLRLDRGDQATDHHSVAILSGPSIDVLHVAFETLDIETVGQGHQHLRGQGWTPFWGIGRHYLGSQVFDYWKDPVGNEWEHYADGDAFDANQPTGYHTLTRGSLWSWGADLPESMRPDVPVDQIDAIHAAGGFGKMELERARGLILALQQPPRPWMR